MKFSCKLPLLLTTSNISFCFLTSPDQVLILCLPPPNLQLPSYSGEKKTIIAIRFRLPIFSPPKTILVPFLFQNILHSSYREWRINSFQISTPSYMLESHALSTCLSSFFSGFQICLFLLDNFSMKPAVISLTLKKSRLLTPNLISFALFYCLLLLALLLELAVHINNLHFITYYSTHLSTQSLLALAIVRIMKDH